MYRSHISNYPCIRPWHLTGSGSFLLWLGAINRLCKGLCGGLESPFRACSAVLWLGPMPPLFSIYKPVYWLNCLAKARENFKYVNIFAILKADLCCTSQKDYGMGRSKASIKRIFTDTEHQKLQNQSEKKKPEKDRPSKNVSVQCSSRELSHFPWVSCKIDILTYWEKIYEK